MAKFIGSDAVLRSAARLWCPQTLMYYVCGHEGAPPQLVYSKCTRKEYTANRTPTPPLALRSQVLRLPAHPVSAGIHRAPPRNTPAASCGVPQRPPLPCSHSPRRLPHTCKDRTGEAGRASGGEYQTVPLRSLATAGFRRQAARPRRPAPLEFTRSAEARPRCADPWSSQQTSP